MCSKGCTAVLELLAAPARAIIIAADPGRRARSRGLRGGAADGAVNWECLAEVFQGLLLLAESGVDKTDVVQSGGFAGSVAGGAMNCECLPVVVQRFLLLAEIVIDKTDVVQSTGFARPVADDA